jgi:hypothetical protein
MTALRLAVGLTVAFTVIDLLILLRAPIPNELGAVVGPAISVPDVGTLGSRSDDPHPDRARRSP